MLVANKIWQFQVAQRVSVFAHGRHYAEESSPLAKTLHRCSTFSELFESFTGYVSHFLLQDLVAEDGEVRSFCQQSPKY